MFQSWCLEKVYSGLINVVQWSGFTVLQDYLYAALQASSYCACGNSYGRYGSGAGCDMACSGDNTQMCGAGMKNTILKNTSKRSNICNLGFWHQLFESYLKVLKKWHK